MNLDVDRINEVVSVCKKKYSVDVNVKSKYDIRLYKIQQKNDLFYN